MMRLDEPSGLIHIIQSGALFHVIAEAIPDIPSWLVLLRELGSFGLIAFIVWWYATKVAPRSEAAYLEAIKEQRQDHAHASNAYLAAIDQQRRDYLESAKSQRTDYLSARSEDRKQLNDLIASLSRLAEITQNHVEEARQVWGKTANE